MSSSIKRLVEQGQGQGIQPIPFNPNNQLAPPPLSMMGSTGGPGLPQHLLPQGQQVDPGSVQSMPATLTSQLTGQGPAIQTPQDQRPPGLIERIATRGGDGLIDRLGGGKRFGRLFR